MRKAWLLCISLLIMLSALTIVGVAEASPAIVPGSTYQYKSTYKISTTVEGRTVNYEGRSEYIVVVEDVNGDYIEYTAYTPAYIPYWVKERQDINRTDSIVSLSGHASDHDGNGYAEVWGFWCYPCRSAVSPLGFEVFVNPNWEEHTDSLRADADALRALPCFTDVQVTASHGSFTFKITINVEFDHDGDRHAEKGTHTLNIELVFDDDGVLERFTVEETLSLEEGFKSTRTETVERYTFALPFDIWYLILPTLFLAVGMISGFFIGKRRATRRALPQPSSQPSSTLIQAQAGTRVLNKLFIVGAIGAIMMAVVNFITPLYMPVALHLESDSWVYLKGLASVLWAALQGEKGGFALLLLYSLYALNICWCAFLSPMLGAIYIIIGISLLLIAAGFIGEYLLRRRSSGEPISLKRALFGLGPESLALGSMGLGIIIIIGGVCLILIANAVKAGLPYTLPIELSWPPIFTAVVIFPAYLATLLIYSTLLPIYFLRSPGGRIGAIGALLLFIAKLVDLIHAEGLLPLEGAPGPWYTWYIFGAGMMLISIAFLVQSRSSRSPESAGYYYVPAEGDKPSAG